MSKLQRPPGFWEGVSSPFVAMSFLSKDPGTWPAALVPTVLFALIGALGMAAGAHWLTPLLVDLTGLADPAGTWAQIGNWLVTALSLLLSATAGVLLGFVLTPPLSAPALEHLVGVQESALGVPPRGKLSMIAEVWCGLKAQVFALAFAMPILAGLWVLEFFVPPLAVLTVPLKVLIISLALAWNLFDYPLTLRGVSPADRIGFIGQHKSAVIGFGLAFATLFWIPCFGVLMLPVGAVAATRLVWRMLVAAPQELPELPRPTTLHLGAMTPEPDIHAPAKSDVGR